MTNSIQTEHSLRGTLAPMMGLIWRRRWTILLICVSTGLVTSGLIYQLQNRYTSEATLFVVEQQVPERYVTPTSNAELAETLPAMTQEVLSRARLLGLVEQFDLYPLRRRHLAPEEVEALMRKDISIEALPMTSGRKEANGFKISFTAPKAILAQEVTSRLTSLFIRENLKNREDQARNTTNFLHDHLDAARQKLAQQEELVRDFKTKYLGELPEQQQGNLAILSGVQLQLQNIEASLDRARQQRVYVESLLSAYRRLRSRSASEWGASPSGTDPSMSPYQSAQANLARLRDERAKLLVNFRSGYPDVLAIDREIVAMQAHVSSLKATVSVETAQSSVDRATPDRPTSSQQEETSSMAQLESQLESNRTEIADLMKDESQEKTTIGEYQNRLNLTPVREEQLAGILRDYELSKQEYAELLGKEQQSQLAMSLEKQQGGQQFRVVDPPSLPDLPSSPKRLKISMGAFGGGLLLGMVGAFLAELKGHAFHSEQDVSRHFSVPLVIGLPLVLGAKQKRRRNWISGLEWVSATVLIATVMVAETWVYRHP